MKGKINKETIFVSILTILAIACFPANPLVLSGAIDTPFYLPAFIIGWVIWAGGMVLVMAPIIQFPHQGGVPKGKSFTETTKVVDTGIYAVVRHPQYVGGIPSIFVTCILWYPHWLFAVLGVIGTTMIYLSIIEEDKKLVAKFGDEYAAYMKRVPGMNIFRGIWQVWRHPVSR